MILVPEYLVPESLIEWGQVPSCLEVLSSEGASFGSTGTVVVKMERNVVSVLPEVGCGVDNLDTMRSTERLLLSTSGGNTSCDTDEGEAVGRLHMFENISSEDDEDEEVKQVLAWETALSPLRDAFRIKVETIFSLPTQTGPSLDNEEEQTDYARRIRVVFEATPAEQKISSPINVVLERRTADTSSGGTWGVGGGLDGRTVSKLIGSDNVSKPFADGKALLISSYGEDSGNSDNAGEMTLSLPGNIVLRHGNTDEGKWFIDLISVSTEGEEKSIMISGTTIVRRIMDSAGGSSKVECYFE